MRTYIIEATNGELNWGKFLLAALDHKELEHVSAITKQNLFHDIGWNHLMIWVLDLQTQEGAAFYPGSSAKHDLDKHQIWVCPLFEPFLEWLYTQKLEDIYRFNLPRHVDLPRAEFKLFGYRREGKET